MTEQATIMARDDAYALQFDPRTETVLLGELDDGGNNETFEAIITEIDVEAAVEDGGTIYRYSGELFVPRYTLDGDGELVEQFPEGIPAPLEIVLVHGLARRIVHILMSPDEAHWRFLISSPEQ